MKTAKWIQIRTLGAILIVMTAALLTGAAVHTGDTAGSSQLPGEILDGLSCLHICGGSESPEVGDTPCYGTLSGGGCSGVTGNYYGVRCSNEGAPSGTANCTGANNMRCAGSNGGCTCSLSYCCTVSIRTCATVGDGTQANPFACSGDGPYTDFEISSRVVCSSQ